MSSLPRWSFIVQPTEILPVYAEAAAHLNR
jgi:hypothetical protein